ncbi:MAG: hypothetical protein H8E35_06195 [Ardenticatenia bacterium]|nr:hypothetical protein [Ardenticatenia bacterium]
MFFRYLVEWRAWLLLGGLALLAWLWPSPLPAQSQGAPDPQISVEGDGGLVTPGGQVSYRIRLLNWTDHPLANGTITHTLPLGFSYVPSSTLVAAGGSLLSQTDPLSAESELIWGPFQLPAAGHTAHNPYGVHTFVQDLCVPEFIDHQLDQALQLVGGGGYVTQLFYRITAETDVPDPCAVYFVNNAYDHNLVPILRLQGNYSASGFWEKPDPGPGGDYAPIAAAFARYVDGLPRRDTHPLYITVWNEPDLWLEWEGTPNASEYGHFFVAVSNAIRDLNDPRIRILNGAVTPANTAFIRQMLTVPGFVKAFDAWASHCYPYNHPPLYNIHNGTARYGNATIDCYIEERDTIATYGGRTGFKFVLTETGHGLGDDLYAFEGFPPINTSNRAEYISVAFDLYWRTWAELIAVTPFELGDPWRGWDWLDWVDYTVSLDPLAFSYTPYRQYNRVAALTKPRGATVPHDIEVTFRAQADPDLSPGIYISVLHGTAGGATTSATQTAAVQVVSHIERLYLPTIGSEESQPKEGVWYQKTPAANPPSQPADEMGPTHPHPPSASTTPTDGAIKPTHFLTRANAVVPLTFREDWRTESVVIEGYPYLLVLDIPPQSPGDGTSSSSGQTNSTTARAYAALANGQMAVIDPNTLHVEQRVNLGSPARALAPAARHGRIYASLESNQVVLVDTASGQIIGDTRDIGCPQGLVLDLATTSLLVVDSDSRSIVRLSQDLAARLHAYPLPDLPNQILLDLSNRRLYVTLPGARQILALDADTLKMVANRTLVGGPLVMVALDTVHGRLYALSALSPHHRGIWVLNTEDLSLSAMVAGSSDVPLRRASALGLLPDGRLLVVEGTHLYDISPVHFGTIVVARPGHPVGPGGLATDPSSGQVIWSHANEIWVRIQ